MIMDSIHGQISYNSCHSKAVKLKLGNNLRIVVVKIKQAPGKEIANIFIRLAKVIPASSLQARCAQQLIMIYRRWKVLMRVEERRERSMVAKTMILVLM